MAGEWIKWCVGFSRKPKVLAMAHALRVDRRIVAAACMELWEWADRETEDGHVYLGGRSGDGPRVTKTSRPRDDFVTMRSSHEDHARDDEIVMQSSSIVGRQALDEVCRLPGLIDQLIEVGWLIDHGNGHFEFRDFRVHNGKSAKARALHAAWQRSHRAASEAVIDSCRSDRHKSITNVRRLCDDTIVTKTSLEKRREEKKNPPTPLRNGDVSSPMNIRQDIEELRQAAKRGEHIPWKELNAVEYGLVVESDQAHEERLKRKDGRNGDAQH